MKQVYGWMIVSVVAVGVGCASKTTQPNALLEKYPQCYNVNPKISKKCVEKNEAGQSTTALELENSAYPGEYK